MPTSPDRNDLLNARGVQLAAALTRVEAAEPGGLAHLQMAAWRLRELLPLLRMDAGSTTRLTRRLRKMVRRLTRARRVDGHLEMLEGLPEIARASRQAVARMKNELRRRKTKATVGVLNRKVAADVRRIEKALAATLERLGAVEEAPSAARELRWAVKARVARRWTAVKAAMDRAGSIYVPGRLHALRRAVRKLRLGVEVLAELTTSVTEAELQLLARAHTCLEEIDAAEALIERVRRAQADLHASEARSFQELDALMLAIQNRCRRLHGRYMRDKAQLLALGARFMSRAAAPTPARRKVG